KARVVSPTQAAPARTPPHMLAERFVATLDLPRQAKSFEVATRWMTETTITQMVVAGDHVTWAGDGKLTVASLADGHVLRRAELAPDCGMPNARVFGHLYAECGNAVAAFDPETLAVRWRRQLEQPIVQLVGGDGAVFVTLHNSYGARWQSVLAL